MTTSRDPPWVLKKAVLVSIPESEIACSASLRVFHDINTNKGSISLKIRADIANTRSRLQDLTLSILPETVDECALSLTNNKSLCSPRLVSMLRASVQSVAAVSTISLILNTTGKILCPRGIESLSPANPKDMNFFAFAKICQNKSVRLHFSNRQFVDDQLNRLKTFSLALNKKSLKAESFRRHSGVDKRDWTVFSPFLDPPPYHEGPVPEQMNEAYLPTYSEESVSKHVVGKRCRDQWTIPPDDLKRHKRLILSSPQPSGSATEVHTPSTFSPSPPSICPTYFTGDSSGGANYNILAHLERELHGVSDDLICKLLKRTGRRHLLAHPEETNSDLSSNSEEVSFAKVEWNGCSLKQYIDETIKSSLTPLINEIADSAVSECCDQIYDGYKIEFCEQVDDGKSEVRITADECIKEIQEEVQRHMDGISEQAQQCMVNVEKQRFEVEMSVEKTVAESKSWFDDALSLLDGKSSPIHKLRSTARRGSF